MEPWYKITTPRPEVREGRSFNPDEFAIALEQVIAGTAPVDYRDPKKFFSRTCFTRALNEHLGLVLRRLSGETQNTAPVPRGDAMLLAVGRLVEKTGGRQFPAGSIIARGKEPQWPKGY